jgi:mono/diheme cytochrome c family protein
MSGLLTGRWLRRLARAAAPLLLGAVAGCGDSDIVSPYYPERLEYPVRSDLLVKKVPSEESYTPDTPGQLQHFVDQLATKDMVEKGAETLNPATLSAGLRDQIGAELKKLFGTPARPRVGDPKAMDDDLRAQVVALKLQPSMLKEGSRQFRRNCLHCHGLPGDGRGPTGPWLNPHPRDYRQGLFKFISTAGSGDRKPRRDDLLRTLHKGVDGTSMPSFGVEDPEILEQLVSYVIHLSIRGEVEIDILDTILGKDANKAKLDDDDKAQMQDKLEKVVKAWAKADKPNEPGAYAVAEAAREASVRRGWQIFNDPEGAASCVKCHVDYGRQSLFRFDSWGTLVRPANLTAGVYRGGRRPIDLYWRITGGIPGANMPAAEKLKPDQAWDLVNFVQAMPYPKMLPEDVRAKVYPDITGKRSEEHASAR